MNRRSRLRTNALLAGVLLSLFAAVMATYGRVEKFREFEYQLLYKNRPAGKATVMMAWQKGDTVKVFTTVELTAPVPLVLEERSLWDASLRPISYAVRAMGPQAATINARCHDGEVVLTVTQGKRTQEKVLEMGENPIFLDNNMISHFLILAMRYNRDQGGSQRFHAAVPQAGSVFPVTLEHKGRKKIEVAGKKMQCDYFRGRMESVIFELWADPQTRELTRMRVRQQDFEAILQSVG